MRVEALKVIVDRREHSFRFTKHLPIVESQDGKTRALKHRSSFHVGVLRVRLEMLTAVNLDDQASFDAGKVSKVLANGVLATKLESGNATIAQVLPYQRFRVS